MVSMGSMEESLHTEANGLERKFVSNILLLIDDQHSMEDY